MTTSNFVCVPRAAVDHLLAYFNSANPIPVAKATIATNDYGVQALREAVAPDPFHATITDEFERGWSEGRAHEAMRAAAQVVAVRGSGA